MHLPGANQFFAFVWGSRNVSHKVVDVARLTSSRAIFDLSAMQFGHTAAALRAAGATAVKIFAPDLMDPELEVFLEESGVKTLWVEYHPDLFPDAPEVFLERLGQLSARCACRPIISDLDLLHLLLQHQTPVRTIALKGNEAAGFVSGDSIGVLFSSVKEMLRESAREMEVVIWGGVATPEAAAAFLATGAMGAGLGGVWWGIFGINWTAAAAQVANGAIVPLCTGAGCTSDFSVFASSATAMVVDVVGYFTPPSGGYVLSVAPSGAQYTSIQAAIDAAAAVATASQHYLVKVAPGTYTEKITLKDFVDIEGSGRRATVIRWSSGWPTVTTGANAELRQVAVVNTSSGAFPTLGAVAVYQTAESPSGNTRLLDLNIAALGTGDNAGVIVQTDNPTLGDRVAQLEDELRRVERERDILKKALAILSRHA